MRVLEHIRSGRTNQLMDEMVDFIDHAISETKEGSLSWLLAAMGMPSYPGEVHAYGTVIGTGNAVVEWDPSQQEVSA